MLTTHKILLQFVMALWLEVTADIGGGKEERLTIASPLWLDPPAQVQTVVVREGAKRMCLEYQARPPTQRKVHGGNDHINDQVKQRHRRRKTYTYTLPIQNNLPKFFQAPPPPSPLSLSPFL